MVATFRTEIWKFAGAPVTSTKALKATRVAEAPEPKIDQQPKSLPPSHGRSGEPQTAV